MCVEGGGQTCPHVLPLGLGTFFNCAKSGPRRKRRKVKPSCFVAVYSRPAFDTKSDLSPASRPVICLRGMRKRGLRMGGSWG